MFLFSLCSLFLLYIFCAGMLCSYFCCVSVCLVSRVPLKISINLLSGFPV